MRSKSLMAWKRLAKSRPWAAEMLWWDRLGQINGDIRFQFVHYFLFCPPQSPACSTCRQRAYQALSTHFTASPAMRWISLLGRPQGYGGGGSSLRSRYWDHILMEGNILRRG